MDTILALEQNESANKLATIANDQNIESVKQGQTLMTFTIITTIFVRYYPSVVALLLSL